MSGNKEIVGADHLAPFLEICANLSTVPRGVIWKLEDLYMGRLCCFNRCPKHKPDCRAANCGRIPFLRQRDGFVLDPDALRADRIMVLTSAQTSHGP
jgi:hypothetical protein